MWTLLASHALHAMSAPRPMKVGAKEEDGIDEDTMSGCSSETGDDDIELTSFS